MENANHADKFIDHWRDTGGSELANTQSFINGLCHLIGVEPPAGILVRLVALNKVRATEEARGQIHWLRPEYQAPNYHAPISQRLDLGEAPAALPDNIIRWPVSLPEQVSAVQAVLAAANAPLTPQDVARAFKNKRAGTVRPVLDALAGIGMARRLNDGRYAA